MTIKDQVSPSAGARGIASAGMWSVSGKLGSRLFDLATLVILTAILEPADFGLVAKAMTVVMIVEMVTLIPVETPILRVKTPEQKLYDTAFTLNLMRAALIGVLLVSLSVPLATFFRDPRLTPLLCWLALGPALRGATSPKLAEFTRRYDMRPEAAMDVASKLTSLIVVSAVAVATRSYWAIAVGTVTTSLVLNVLSYVFAPYRPRLSLRHWHDFKDIVTWVTLSQMLQAMNWQIDNFILGRMLGNDTFGRFAIARQLTDIPFQALAVPVTRPMVAAFSAADDDAERGRQWLSFSSGTLFAVGPFMVTLAVLSAEVVFVLLGPGWDKAELYLLALALTTLPVLAIMPMNPLAVATFRTRLVAQRVSVQFLISVPAITVGAIAAGVMGAILARGAVEVFMFLYISTLVRSELGLPLRTQFTSHWRSLVGISVLVLCLLAVRDLGAGLTDGSRVLTGLRLAVLSLPCFAAYVAVCMALWRATDRPDGAEAYLYRKATARIGRRV